MTIRVLRERNAQLAMRLAKHYRINRNRYNMSVVAPTKGFGMGFLIVDIPSAVLINKDRSRVKQMLSASAWWTLLELSDTEWASERARHTVLEFMPQPSKIAKWVRSGNMHVLRSQVQNVDICIKKSHIAAVTALLRSEDQYGTEAKRKIGTPHGDLMELMDNYRKLHLISVREDVDLFINQHRRTI